MRGEIPTSELRGDLVPDAASADGDEIARFAHTFDGYAHFGEDWSTPMHAVRERWTADGSLPDAIDDLRACLFLEQRMERFVDYDVVGLSEPDADGVRTVLHGDSPAAREHERYKRALVQRIGELLASSASG